MVVLVVAQNLVEFVVQGVDKAERLPDEVGGEDLFGGDWGPDSPGNQGFLDDGGVVALVQNVPVRCIFVIFHLRLSIMYIFICESAHYT